VTGCPSLTDAELIEAVKAAAVSAILINLTIASPSGFDGLKMRIKPHQKKRREIGSTFRKKLP
jgi:hypothetical protein